MRRLTKAQPMGGASLCSFISSAAYSGGSASGMVAMSWATFMIGPLRPPSAAASSMAFLPRSRLKPNKPRAGDAGRDAAHIGADARIARGAGGETVGFVIGGTHRTYNATSGAGSAIRELKISRLTPSANCRESNARGFLR